MFSLSDFVAESNRIEGIHREPTIGETEATSAFLRLPSVSVLDLCHLVRVYQPGNRLRDMSGLNVRVGSHIAPEGGPDIRVRLQAILQGVTDPWQQHIAYETLHPFTDGNGRSGRALWLWQMTKQRGGAPLGFLHTFYYQTLERIAR